MTDASPTLGSLLRHLVEILDQDVEAAYRADGLDYRARYTPVVRVLGREGPSSIKKIAQIAGLTHSATSQTVAQMVRAGLALSEPGSDGRERIVRLSPAAVRLLPRLRQHWDAANAAAAGLSEELGLPLEQALQRAIQLLEERSFLERLTADKRRRARASKTPA